MERKKFLLITAGGRGTRMKSLVPKQFMRLNGKALLQLSMERFIEADPEIKIVAVLPEEHIGQWKAYCLKEGFISPQTLVAGGITRFHSVRNGLERIPDGALVAVHDGVRPFVPVSLIKTLFEAAASSPAVVPVIPCTDTLKVLRRTESPDGSSELRRIAGEHADRSVLFGAQTPQVFHSEVLREAYSQPFDTSFTDDASVVEKKNIPVTYIEGSRYNIKITTQEDLQLAEALRSILF